MTKVKKVLIIGQPFSGKSYISKKLQKLGVNAVDADLVKGLSKWVDKRGQKVEFPNDANRQWLQRHKFIWDKEFLSSYLKNCELPIYFFGTSSNVYGMTNLFSQLYFLDITPEIFKQRATRPERTNPMGKTQEQQKMIISGIKSLREKAVKSGFTAIDADQEPEQILAILTKEK